jgi:hypothetical protein
LQQVRIQKLGPWIDADLDFPDLQVSVQFGHHMCIRGAAQFVDGSTLTFTYELFGPSTDNFDRYDGAPENPSVALQLAHRVSLPQLKVKRWVCGGNGNVPFFS